MKFLNSLLTLRPWWRSQRVRETYLKRNEFGVFHIMHDLNNDAKLFYTYVRIKKDTFEYNLSSNHSDPKNTY